MYEAHLTINSGDVDRAGELAEKYGWKQSRIDGDPVLGPGVNTYWTKHHTNLLALHDHMVFTMVALREIGVRPIRQKIELIVYDSKTGIGVGA